MLSPWVASFYLKHHYAVLKLLTFFNRLFCRFTWSWHQWTQRTKKKKTAVWFAFLVNLCMCSFMFTHPNAGFIILLWVLSTHAGSLLSCSISVTFVLISSGNISSASLDKLYWKYDTMRLVRLVMDDMRALVYCYTLSGFGLHPFFCFFFIFWWCNKRLHLGDGGDLSFESTQHIKLGKRLDIRNGWLDTGTMQSLLFGVVVAGRGSGAEIDNESRT